MRVRPSRQAWSVVAVLSAMALVVLDSGLVTVALPTIADQLAGTPARAVMVVSAYQLALLMGLLPSAQVAERLGHRRLFAIGLAVFLGSSLLCALAPSLPLLVAARFLQGLGGSAIMALGIALLRFTLGPERLGAAIAWNALVVATCSAAGPAVGALLLSFADWPWLFLAGLPVGTTALLAARALPEGDVTRRSVNPVSIALYATAAASIVVAAQLAAAMPLLAAGVALAAVASGLWLVRRERGETAPLVPVDLLAARPFRASVAASALLFTGQTAGLLALPFYIQLALGRTAMSAGLILALWSVAVAAASPVANRLAGRFASAPLCAVGAALLAAGLAAAAIWPVGRSLAPLAGCALVCGVGFGLFQVPNNRALFLGAPPARSAAAGGMQGTARLAGQTAGALLVTFVLSTAPAALAPRLVLSFAGLAALIAALVSWRRDAPIPALPAPMLGLAATGRRGAPHPVAAPIEQV